MVRQNIPTVLRIDRGELRPTPLAQVNPNLPEMGAFLGLFTEASFTAAMVAERIAALGAWSEPLIQDLDDEHQFEGRAPWGIDTDRPSDSLWKLYCESLSRRYPTRSPLIISNPISLEDLPATFLNAEIRRRLPQCSNLLFILRSNLHEYWFGDLDFRTTTLHILTPWPGSAVSVTEILLAHGGLDLLLRVAVGDPTCRIGIAQSYNISTPPLTINRSWRYVLRAVTLWHETSIPGAFWPITASLVDSKAWGIPGFMCGLSEILYQQQNEDLDGPTPEPQSLGTVDMPPEVARVLLGLTRHIKAIEFAKWEIDNGVEAILFSGIPSTLDDECGNVGNMVCPVEVTAFRRSQKQIVLGTIPAIHMGGIGSARHAERFRRQMDTHTPEASAELIAANRLATQLQWNRGVNKFMIALDENGQGFIKGLELPLHPTDMSTCVNSTNIFNARPPSAMLPSFAYLEIDNQRPIFWFQRRRPDLEPEDRIMGTGKYNFYGPTPWVVQEPLCTEAVASPTPATQAMMTILEFLCNDLDFVPEMVAARATRFGQWTLGDYTSDDFEGGERFQRTPGLPDPRGLEPKGWLTSDIMDAVTSYYEGFHPEAEIFSDSLTALLVITGDPSHLSQRRLGARFWIFIQSNVQANHLGNHWWISIVDRVKGHLFSHNSLRGLGDPSILFNVLRPIFESPVVQNIAGSAATLTLPENTVVDVPQQQNGYDCGVYSVRSLTGFLEGLGQIEGPIPTGGESQAARSYIPENWSTTEYRGALRNSFPIRPLQRANAPPTPRLLLNLVSALLHANHRDHRRRAMWHLDNAGGILLQMNSLPVDAYGCLCQNQDNGCGFSVVPVPPGYKVVLMSDSTLSAGSWTRAQNLPLLPQYLAAYRTALMRLNRNNRLSNLEREELRDKYLTLASDTAQVLVGSRIERVGNPPQGYARAGFLPDDNTDKIIEILESNSKTYGGHTVRLPRVAYIRINDQVWIWVARSLTRSAAERWRVSPTMMGAAVALTGAGSLAPKLHSPLVPNIGNIELRRPTHKDSPLNVVSAVDRFRSTRVGKEPEHQQTTNQLPGPLPYSDSEDSLPYDEQDDLEDRYGIEPRKEKRFYPYSSSEEDERGIIDRDIWTRPRKRLTRMNTNKGALSLPPTGQLGAGNTTFTINITSILMRTFPLPPEHNFSYVAIRSYLVSQSELFPASTLSYRMAGIDPTPLSNQSDYLAFHSQMSALPVRQRLGYIAVHQPMAWTTVMQFRTGDFVYERTQEPTRDWNTFILKGEPFPVDQVFTGYANIGGATFTSGSAAILQTHWDLERLFYAAAENEFSAIRVVVRRSLEVDSTDRATATTVRITATRYSSDGVNAIAGPITAVVASAMQSMDWSFLSALIAYWLGTSDSLTYVLPQSATGSPAVLDSQHTFQSMIDESNKLPDGERQLSLVIREPRTMDEIEGVRAKSSAQNAELGARDRPIKQLRTPRTREQITELVGMRDLESTNRTTDTAAEDSATELEILKAIELATKVANAGVAVRAAEARAAEGRGNAPEEEVMHARKVAKGWAKALEARRRIGAHGAKVWAAKTGVAQADVTVARAWSRVARLSAKIKTTTANLELTAGATETRLAVVWALSAGAKGEVEAKAKAVRAAAADLARARADEVKEVEARAVADRAAVVTVRMIEGAAARAADRAALAAVVEAGEQARSMASAPQEAAALSGILEEGGDSRQLERAREVPAQAFQGAESTAGTTAPMPSEPPAAIRGSADIVQKQGKYFRAEQEVWTTREHTMPESIAHLSDSSGRDGSRRPRGRGEDQASDQASDQAAEEEEGVPDDDGDDNEGEGEAAGPTPAELLAAGDRIGSDGRRYHQREGR